MVVVEEEEELQKRLKSESGKLTELSKAAKDNENGGR